VDVALEQWTTPHDPSIRLVATLAEPADQASFATPAMDRPPFVNVEPPLRPVVVHPATPVVHGPSPHGHEASSTPSTPLLR